MTRKEMYSLKEGDVVYCIKVGLHHRFYYGQRLTRFITERDEYDNVCFKGDNITQYLSCDEISFTNPIINIMSEQKPRKGWQIVEILLSIAPAIINIFKKKK